MAQNLILQIWDGAAWQDQPAPLSQAPVKVTRGDDGESGKRPAKIEAMLPNDDGRYRTSDPASPLYGIAGRNTRLRVRVDGSTLTQAEAASWRPGKTQDHTAGVRGLAWCDLTAEGMLSRIGKWTTPLRSPLYRAISRHTTLLGYWPMEDGREATQLTNAVAQGKPAILREAELGGADPPGGSDDLVKITAATSITGTFAKASTTAGWQISFAAKLAVMPSSATYWPYMQWWTANGNRWTMEVNNTTYRWVVIDTTGALVKTVGPVSFGTGAEPDQWVIHRVKVSQVGGNVQVEPAWYAEGLNVYGITDTYAGSVSVVNRWRVSGNAWNLDGGIGHIFAVTGVADDLQATYLTDSFDGFPGELAGTRFLRLMEEEGLSKYMTGVVADTAAMGRQRSGTLRSHLDEIIDTEGCMIYDERLDIALRMITRRVLYNQPVALALDVTDLVAYEEVTDDLGTANVVTTSNSGGGDYTASLDTGLLSTLPPPAGIGEAKTEYKVNVFDEGTQLQQLAEWYLGLGTMERARYPKLTVDLLRNPSLIAAVMACDISDRITVTNLERQTVDLIVIGTVETIGHDTRKIDFTCIPAYITHSIGIWDDAGSRYDSKSTTLAAGCTAGAATMALTTTDRRDCWSTTETPYACEVDGEEVTVTAMTAPAGTGPWTQTATVTRGVNGVPKAHLAGANFRLAYPVYAGL